MALVFQNYYCRFDIADINSEMVCKNCYGKCVSWFWIWASSHYSGKEKLQGNKKA